jgi:hypothetical protein
VNIVTTNNSTGELSVDNTAGQDPSVCRNCETVMAGDFCQACGQSVARSHRLNVRQILADFFSRLINLYSSFIRTFFSMTMRPGIVCREYVDGKRIGYTNPVGYLILASVVVAVATRLVRAVGGDQADAIEAFSENWGTQLGLLSCVPMALLLWKLLRQMQFNLAENYVFSLYVLAQCTWFELAYMPFLPFPGVADVALSVYFIGTLAYFTFAAKQFYQESTRRIVVAMGITLIGVMALRLAVSPIWPLEN